METAPRSSHPHPEGSGKLLKSVKQDRQQLRVGVWEALLWQRLAGWVKGQEQLAVTEATGKRSQLARHHDGSEVLG